MAPSVGRSACRLRAMSHPIPSMTTWIRYPATGTSSSVAESRSWEMIVNTSAGIVA